MSTHEQHLLRLRAALSRLVEFPDAAWAAARTCFSLHRFEAGTHVLEAGQVVDTLYFLLAGLARYYYLDTQGREFNKSFSGPGQVLSSVSSLVSGQPAPFFVQALQPSECLAIPYKQFVRLAEHYPPWARLRLILLEQLVIKKEGREADFLLLSAEARYRKFLAEFAPLCETIPNYHIASYLGISEVALSRIRRRMGLTRVNAKSAD